MASRRQPTIVDAEGVTASLRTVRVRADHEAIAVAVLGNGTPVAVPFQTLEHHDDGGYSMPGRWRDFLQSTGSSVVVPVIAEKVVTRVREAPRRTLRIRRRVVEQPTPVETPIWQERIDVQHVPVDAFVETAPSARWEGDVLVVPCVEQVVVVETRLKVREELRIRTIREQVVDRQTITLRRHEVEIEPQEQDDSINPNDEGEHT